MASLSDTGLPVDKPDIILEGRKLRQPAKRRQHSAMNEPDSFTLKKARLETADVLGKPLTHSKQLFHMFMSVMSI